MRAEEDGFPRPSPSFTTGHLNTKLHLLTFVFSILFSFSSRKSTLRLMRRAGVTSGVNPPPSEEESEQRETNSHVALYVKAKHVADADRAKQSKRDFRWGGVRR